MITIDTNILARHLLQDDIKQCQDATLLLETKHCFVPITVTLELIWVLTAKKISKENIIGGMRKLMATDTLTFQYKDDILEALTWAETSIEITDAIHLIMARQQQATPFYSFDKNFVTQSQQLDNDISCQLPQ